jgi:hypothetical protein
MDWHLLGIAALLTLSGLYLLEQALTQAPIREVPRQLLQPARDALERAWQAEPVHVFMRQLFFARQQRNSEGAWHLWML